MEQKEHCAWCFAESDELETYEFMGRDILLCQECADRHREKIKRMEEDGRRMMEEEESDTK